MAIEGKTFGQSGPTNRPRGHPSWLAKFDGAKLLSALIYAWGARNSVGNEREWRMEIAAEEHRNGRSLTSPKDPISTILPILAEHQKRNTGGGPELALVFSIFGR